MCHVNLCPCRKCSLARKKQYDKGMKNFGKYKHEIYRRNIKRRERQVFNKEVRKYYG